MNVKYSWAETLLELEQAREALFQATLKLEKIAQKKKPRPGEYSAAKKVQVRLQAKVDDLTSIELNLRRIAGIKSSQIIPKPSHSKRGDA